jgi:hypothetical protein
MAKKKTDRTQLIKTKLQEHFGNTLLSSLMTARRKFPITAMADLQASFHRIFTERYPAAPIGISREYDYSPLEFSTLLMGDQHPAVVGPLRHNEIDVGNLSPARCLEQALWLPTYNSLPFAILLSQSAMHRTPEIYVEVVVTPGDEGHALSEQFLSNLEQLVREAGSYRGKVISLEQLSNYSGQAGEVKVHKLHTVAREDIILPSATLDLLDRNVSRFIAQRPRLKEMGMPTKKGLLFYGAPGTGKTHTVHYLANQLPDHTTLLITAGQVGLLDDYFQLARFLQPAIVVIEDADLIARDRKSMSSPCEEVLLNKLLNEMDGLRQDSAILFVLTTNRPEELEGALSARPGRIDQAIEFPLPDPDGRRKLFQLYSCGLPLKEEMLAQLVQRTEGASPAFIKELMRRIAQYYLEDGEVELKEEHVRIALEDLLFGGGTLNVKLLGGKIKS